MSVAANIEFEESFLGPFGRSVHIHVDGALDIGDSARIRNFVNNLKYSDDLRIHVTLNSPGGLVSEGLDIGKYFASLPVTVTTSVSGKGDKAGECASACVFAYIGGHYRYLDKNSRIGVHQFYLGDGSTLSAPEGVAISQILAGDIVSFLDKNRVEPDFFRLISTVSPDRIHWVPEDTLRQFRVVTGPVYDQKAEFKNVDGYFYLLLWQQSYYGENKIVAVCAPSGSMVFSSYIQPADIQTFDHLDYTFEILIDGVGMQPATWEPGPKDNRWAITNLSLDDFQLEALLTASSFGARHLHKSGIFLGFEFALEDSKLSNLVKGCEKARADKGPSKPVTTTQRVKRLLDQPLILWNTDIPGGDFDNKGLRGISAEQCLDLCLSLDHCVGFSWVERSGWCWPKHTEAPPSSNPGVTSVIIRR